MTSIACDVRRAISSLSSGPAVDQPIAILRDRICPWADARNSVEYIKTNACDILSSHRRDVVIVEQVGVAD